MELVGDATGKKQDTKEWLGRVPLTLTKSLKGISLTQKDQGVNNHPR